MTYQPNYELDTIRPINESKLNDLLTMNRLNWEVGLEPMYIGDVKTRFMGVVRKDNNHCFQAVSKSYEPMQNRELMELALTISDITGAEIEVSKSLCNGSVAYISLKGKEYQIEGKKVGDVVGEKFILVNSHDGSKAFGVGFGHTILSCTNGMTRFDRKGFISIRHTSNMKSKLKDCMKGMQRIANESQSMIETYHRLIEQPITQDHVKHVLELVADVDSSMSKDQLSTRKKNIVESVWSSLNSEMSYKGQNAWGLLNGVTHYTTKIANNDKKLRSKMFGASAKKDLSVWEFLTTL